MLTLLSQLKTWAPFRLDALGIVTLLGADQMDTALGKLAQTGLAGLLPVLGAFKIADNSIVKPIPGFVLYNISDGILATDIAGWFARWLLCQDIGFNTTTLTLNVKRSGYQRKRLRRPSMHHLLPYVVATMTMGPLLVLTLLLGDWWGLANWTAMAISVVVRRIVLDQNLAALDIASSRADARSCEPVKALLTLPSGNAATIKAPRGVILDCLLTTPQPPNSSVYTATRMVGWLGFGVHVVSLGMTSLLNQILAVMLLLIATILVGGRVGDNDNTIGNQLEILRKESVGPDFRAAAMARLELSPRQEDNMLAWNLFPQRSNTDWWKKYHICQASVHGGDFKDWDKMLAAPFIPPTGS